MNTRCGRKLGLVAIAGFAMASGTILGASPALAVPITYTETATASGSLNGVSFTSATIVLTENSDTANVGGGGGVFHNLGTVALQINGGPPVNFTESPEAIDIQTGLGIGAGFSTSGFSILLDNNNIFKTYDLSTAIGPISGTPFFASSGLSFPTSGGAFILTSTAGTDTFTATLGAAVPEPSSLAIFGMALVGLGLIRRRRSPAAPKA